MQEDILSILKDIPFLANLPDEDLTALASHAKKGSFPKRAIIITEGEETESLYILLTGKVRVFSSDESGKEVTLKILESGSYFGELSLLDNEPRSVSIMTLEKVTCGIISKSNFKQWLKEHPDATFGLIQDLSKKIRSLTHKIKDLALSNVYERTIKILKEMAVEKDGVLTISDKITQQELANMVGSSREMVNKIMKELTKGGYIVMDDKSIKIVKKLPLAW